MFQWISSQPGGNQQTSRRNWLRFSLLGSLGLALGRQQSSAASPERSLGRAKRCILVFLNGGPSQLDTWDMKPDASAEVRGELKPIATSVPGTHVSELFPGVARHIDKLKIVRTVTHTASVHTTGVYTMLTGTYHATPKVDQTRAMPTDHPHLGSIVSRHHGWQTSLPPFVSLPMLFQAPPVDGIWPGQNAGFLGRVYDPFVITGDKQTAGFSAPAVELPPDMMPERLHDRRSLLSRLDAAVGQLDRSPVTEQRAQLWDQAFAMLGNSDVQKAVDLSRESVETRDRYGNHLFGQGLLLARRLIEAGESFVTAYWIDPTPAGAGGGEYDSHGRIYWHMRQRLAAPTDQALAALVSDLWERGLHEDTLLVVMSEFGRTPRLNADAGRDHWPHAQSILLGGAGISAGAVHGATDKHAAYPIADPVTPPDLGQSILHLVGVPANLELNDLEGRPIPASYGRVNRRLIS
jgi:uncharacterized protein (DUF1501 family)